MIYKNENCLELLAPGGSFDALKAAYTAGADAVYMGGNKFSARAYAESASEDSILESIDYAHIHRRKLYMTVNTLLKPDEIEKELYDYILPVYEAGIDAVLVQDIGVFSFLKREFPDLSLHASTQMTVTSPESAMLLKKLGFSRVVAARELSLLELEDISKKSQMELEAFVHGAICYCYSGQCLYSGVIGKRSGNRGRCAQPCRLPYNAVDRNGNILNKKNENYLLSLKDMCTLQYIPELIKAGVMSFKIEGRMKSPVYTAGIVSIYRKYIDRYIENPSLEWKVDEDDIRAVSEFFDRGGFTDSYLNKHNGRDMIVLKEKPSFRAPDIKIIKETEKKYIQTELKEKIRGFVTIKTNECAKMSLEYGDIFICAESSEPVTCALKHPLLKENVEKQLRKTGSTPFLITDLKIDMSDDAYMTVKQLNELRRDAVLQLINAIKEKSKRSVSSKKDEVDKKELYVSDMLLKLKKHIERPIVSVEILRSEQLDEAVKSDVVNHIYIDSGFVDFNKLAEIADICHKRDKKLFIVLPKIYRKEACKVLKKGYDIITNSGIDGFVCGNLDILAFLMNKKCRLPIITDHSLYTWNDESKMEISSFTKSDDIDICCYTSPLELSFNELKKRGCEDSEIYIYGNMPMMVSAGCVYNTTKGCSHKNPVIILKDRKNVEFSCVSCCKYCYNVIYNSVPVNLIDKYKDIKSLNPLSLRISFTLEDKEQIKKVLLSVKDMFNSLKISDEKKSGNNYTRGHFIKGVQ